MSTFLHIHGFNIDIKDKSTFSFERQEKSNEMSPKVNIDINKNHF